MAKLLTVLAESDGFFFAIMFFFDNQDPTIPLVPEGQTGDKDKMSIFKVYSNHEPLST